MKKEIKEIWKFVILTYLLTAINNSLVYIFGYSEKSLILLQSMMLIPAFSAILLIDNLGELLKISKIFAIFIFSYLIYFFLYFVLGIYFALLNELFYRLLVTSVLQLFNIYMLIIALLLHFSPIGKRLGLTFGKLKLYFYFSLLLFVFYVGSSALNCLFGLGEPIYTGYEWQNLFFVFITAVVVSPFIALPIAFGEEFGWRIYLQDRMVALYGTKGIMMVGIIWGIWHVAIIMMGHNYPGHPFIGSLLMILYCIGLGIVFGIAVLNSRSAWLAAYLHAFNNQLISYLYVFICKPKDTVFSFGIGIYGIAILFVISSILYFKWTRRFNK